MLLWTLGLVQSLHLLSFSLLMPLGPQFARLWHLPPLQFGFLAGAYPLAAGITGLLVMLGTRHLPGKRSIILPGAGFVLAGFLSAMADDFQELLLGRILAGIMGGLLCAWLPDVVARTVRWEERSRGLKHVLATQPFWTLSLGLPLLLGVAWKWSWAESFFLLSAVSLAAVIGLFILLPSSRREEKERRTHLRSMMILLRHGGYRGIFVMSCALTGSAAILVTFFSGIMVINMDLGEGRLALLFLAGGCGTLVALPLMEKWSARWDPWPVFVGSGVVSAGCILFLVAIPLHRTWWAAGAGILFMISNVLRFVPAVRLWQRHLKPRHGQRFVALQAVLQQVVAGAAMVLAGVLMWRDGQGPLLGYERLGGVALLALVVALGMAWRRRKVERLKG